MRKVTNIIVVDEIAVKVPAEMLPFVKEGVLDAHKACEELGGIFVYQWLYKNTNIDLIAWQVKHNCFNWQLYSMFVPKYAPQCFDAEKFNWEKCSSIVAMYCPQHFDGGKFNWEKDGVYARRYCPEKVREYLDLILGEWKGTVVIVDE